MWIFPTRKQIKKELTKISKGFHKRDKRLNYLKSQIEKSKVKIARLEGNISILINKSQSQSQTSIKQVSDNFETRLIKRLRKSKSSIVMAEISKLRGSMSVLEMLDKIVYERKLCSRASFYRYLSSLKSQEEVRLRQR
jgi:septal ring factor EnvC (AmiA/AmiB activator)